MTKELKRCSQFTAGLAAQQKGLHQQAINHYQSALTEGDRRPQVWLNLAVAFANTKRFDAAELLYRRILKQDPNNASAWTNYGNLLCKQQLFEQAERAHRKALALQPNDVLCLYNAGNVPFHSNQPRAALNFFNEVLKRQPQHHGARWNRALALLQLEQWQPGFAGYEVRLEQHQNLVKPINRINPPKDSYWQGQSLDGQRLLLTTEQGYGDVIQFARYCVALKQRFDVHITVQVRPALKRLMACCPAVDEVITRQEALSAEAPSAEALSAEAPPAYDYYFPLLSLARMVETKQKLLPITAYLQAPSDALLSSAIKRQIARIKQTKKIKIGLNWQGKLSPYDRGCPLNQLAPLLIDERFEFFSLQQGREQDLVDSGLDGFIHNLGQDVHDFADTAALMQALDLVISIDSAPAHLAGALNKPCLVMLLKYNDWRWHLARNDSPWYPKMRLYRQKNQGEWASVVAQITRELGHFADRNMDFNSFFATTRNTQ